MMRILTTLCTALLCLVAAAENNCNVSLATDTILIGGEQLTVSIHMENEMPITLLQADLVLPQGVTVARENDALQILCSNRSNGHAVASNILEDGSVRLLLLSDANNAFSGKEGQVAGIRLDVAPDIAEDVHEIRLTNILLVQPSEEYYRLSNATISLAAINEDSATAIRNTEAEGSTSTTPYNISGQRARQNEKGVIIQHGKKTAVK